MKGARHEEKTFQHPAGIHLHCIAMPFAIALLSFLFVGVCHAQKVTCINSNEIAVEGDTIIYFDAE